jgi:CubicO group peptidase (beta-lactamase class C family)
MAALKFKMKHSTVKAQLLLMLLMFMFNPLRIFAQDKSAEVDKLLAFASATSPGVVVAVFENGTLSYHKAVGFADIEKLKPLELGSVFDIGSARKQFVAAAILLLVEDKKLSLSDDVHTFFPKLPDYGKKITVDHLLTHTSGIRDWTGMQGLAGDNPDAMTLIMRQKKLNFLPGEEWSYSNSGYVLLAEIVGKVSGIPFAQFLSERIFAPLGMKSSSYVMDLRSEIAGRAIGYRKDQTGFVKHMLLDNDRGGAGALFSTASDLILWNNALTSGTLGKVATQRLMEHTKLNNGRVLDYGRGLVLEGNLIWHSGGAAGYHSWIGRVPERGLSVAVLCNSDIVAASALAEKILTIYAPGAGRKKGEDGAPPTLTGEALSDAKNYAGLFVSDSGEILRLAVDRDRFRVAGGPGLVEVSKGKFRRWGSSVFFMSQDAFTLEFVSASQLSLLTMEGNLISYKKALNYAPSAEQLADFVGSFSSSEVGASFDFSAGEGVLIGKSGDKGEAITFKPIFKDAFQVAGIVVRFVRNTEGKVVSLKFSNPVVRDITFMRK